MRLSGTAGATVANAGHLAPYWNGKEVATEPALPLGVDESATYNEVQLRMHLGDRLTLMTDRVLGAVRKHQLLGFERAALISTHDARTVAAQAVQFGQVDDVTVISLVAETLT